MTLEELNEYFRLLGRLNKARELLASLEASAAPRSPHLDGMPHVPGYSDRIGSLAAEIADMRERVSELEDEARWEGIEVARFTDGIPDYQAQLIFRLRFLRGLSWGEVAAVIGGGNTENSVKCICYRFFRREKLQRRDAP